MLSVLSDFVHRHGGDEKNGKKNDEKYDENDLFIIGFWFFLNDRHVLDGVIMWDLEEKTAIALEWKELFCLPVMQKDTFLPYDLNKTNPLSFCKGWNKKEYPGGNRMRKIDNESWRTVEKNAKKKDHKA